ncbi:MAG: TMEM165/GDT1 family protein [Chloroflexi bacterium]|nr:TMEM165/GDT1 family protein [Chloroflexota bacterium]
MGDKTQLVSLAFATRFRAPTVLAGILVATLAVHLGSVAIGEALGLAMPTMWIKIGAGLAFVAFGAWTLRGDKLDDGAEEKRDRFGPFATVAFTFFLAELGDKTQLATVTLASEYRAFVPVWIGSTLGMVIADGLAILIGIIIGKNLPERLIRIGAAVVFIGAGIATLVEAVWR